MENSCVKLCDTPLHPRDVQLFRNVSSPSITHLEWVMFPRVDTHTLHSLRAPLPKRKSSQRQAELYDPTFHCKVYKMIMKKNNTEDKKKKK